MARKDSLAHHLPLVTHVGYHLVCNPPSAFGRDSLLRLVCLPLSLSGVWWSGWCLPGSPCSGLPGGVFFEPTAVEAAQSCSSLCRCVSVRHLAMIWLHRC